MTTSKVKDISRINKLIRDTDLSLQDIQPLIHRSKFSGDYNYEEVEQALGPLKIDNQYREKAIERNYTYNKKAYRNFQSGTVVFLFKAFAPYSDPQLGYLKPKCIVETSHSTPEFLSKISKALPDLKVMSLEYAIDFYCINHQQVSKLFFLLRRYAYVPYSKRALTIGWEFQDNYDHDILQDTNAVYKIYFQRGKGKIRLSPGKYVKFYERGNDSDKILLANGKKGWRHQDTNRVRFEVTFNRKNGTLAKNGIRSLRDLIRGPKFQQIFFPSSMGRSHIPDQLQFKNFRDNPTGKLPTKFQDYEATDNNQNFECFMNEYFYWKDIVTNISRETQHTNLIKHLKNRCVLAAKLFNKKWIKQSKKIQQNI